MRASRMHYLVVWNRKYGGLNVLSCVESSQKDDHIISCLTKDAWYEFKEWYHNIYKCYPTSCPTLEDFLPRFKAWQSQRVEAYLR